MSNLLKYILAFLVVGIIVFGCKKEQPELINPTEDCDCAKEVSADFYMEEMITLWDHPTVNYFTNTDTIWQGKTVRFRAKDSTINNIKWILGSDEEYAKEVIRIFPDALAGQSLPITCIVEKNPNSICFPLDDGKDTLTKFITVANYNQRDSSYLLEGDFKVRRNNLADSIIINVDIGRDQFNNIQMTVSNYDGLGGVLISPSTDDRFNYREDRFNLTIGNCIIKNNFNKFYLEIEDFFTENDFYFNGRKL